MSTVIPADISTAREEIAAGRLSARKLVDLVLGAIERQEPLVNAFITVDPGRARERADALDRAWAAGQPVGSLHGIPVALKDNIAVARWPTTLGSRIARDLHQPADSALAERLEAAGAIIVGKNNIHEMALGATSINPWYGDVHNPWDRARTPGGSSGGSAAAVASGQIHASFGSDSGGSVRMPASFTGIVGLKPTHGRVSLRGLVGGSWSIDHLGPMARTVRDAAILYEAVAGHDPLDPESARIPVEPVLPGIEDTGRLRVGVIDDHSMGWVHPEVTAALRHAADLLAGEGLTVERTTLPDIQNAPYAVMGIAYPDVSGAQRDWIRTRPAEYGADIRPLVQIGELLTASQYVIAQRSRAYFVRQVERAFGGADLLLMPATAITAPLADGSDANPEDPFPLFTVMRFTTAFNLSGHPGISVPIGIDRGGMPIGAQLVARPYAEATLFRAARALERAVGWRHRFAMGGDEQQAGPAT